MLFSSLRRLMGLWAEQPSAPPSRDLDGASRPPLKADNPPSGVLEIYLCGVWPAGSEFAFLDRTVALRAFPCVVGRHPECDHQVACPAISRRHCAFLVRGGRVWVEDLGSRNGTLLNEAPLTEARPVADGDRLRLARLTFHVQLREAPAAAPGERGAAPGRSGPAARPLEAPVVQAGGAEAAPAPF